MKSRLLGTVSAALIVIGSVLLITGCSDNKQTAKQASVDNSSSTTSIQATTTASEPEGHTIPGITADDVKLSLKKWNITFALSEFSDDQYYMENGKATDADSGIELSCTIKGTDPSNIEELMFWPSSTLPADSQPDEKYYAASEEFLGSCVSLPFDGADPEKAKAWISANFRNLKPFKPIITTIGSIEYRLSGNGNSCLLSMEPVQS